MSDLPVAWANKDELDAQIARKPKAGCIYCIDAADHQTSIYSVPLYLRPTFIPAAIEEGAVIYDDDEDDAYRSGWNACRATIEAGNTRAPSATSTVLGEIRNVRTWDRALTDEEIAEEFGKVDPATSAGVDEVARDAERYRETMSERSLSRPYELIDVVRYVTPNGLWTDKKMWDDGIDFAIDNAIQSAARVDDK